MNSQNLKFNVAKLVFGILLIIIFTNLKKK